MPEDPYDPTEDDPERRLPDIGDIVDEIIRDGGGDTPTPSG